MIFKAIQINIYIKKRIKSFKNKKEHCAGLEPTPDTALIQK